MICPICTKKFSDIDAYIKHLIQCRKEEQAKEAEKRKERLQQEKNKRCEEVKNAFMEAQKAKDKALKLQWKLEQDYPEIKYDWIPEDMSCIITNALKEIYGTNVHMS